MRMLQERRALRYACLHISAFGRALLLHNEDSEACILCSVVAAELCSANHVLTGFAMQMVMEPGQSWLNFKFDRAAIMHSMAMSLNL